MLLKGHGTHAARNYHVVLVCGQHFCRINVKSLNCDIHPSMITFLPFILNKTLFMV